MFSCLKLCHLKLDIFDYRKMASTEDDHPASTDLTGNFVHWQSKLSVRLAGLLAGAEQESWPFVPEEWQYGDDNTTAINVKDLLNANSTSVPGMAEKDILLVSQRTC